MKKFIFIIVGVLTELINFASCASIPESKDVNSTLLYGFSVYSVSEEYTGRVYLKSLSLTIKGLDNGKIYHLLANSDSELIKTGVEPGRYFISKVSGVQQQYGTVCSYYIDLEKNMDPATIFVVKPGVTNLGLVNISIDYSEGETRFQFPNYYEDAREIFKEYHPDSPWNKAEWNDFGSQ